MMFCNYVKLVLNCVFLSVNYVMASKKIIQINPKFLTSGEKKSKRNRAKKSHSTLRKSIKPNNIKKQLMAKIKQHQQQHRTNIKNEEQSKQHKIKQDKETQEFNSDFDKQINYLEKMIHEKKEQRKKKQHTKRRRRKNKSQENQKQTPALIPQLSSFSPEHTSTTNVQPMKITQSSMPTQSHHSPSSYQSERPPNVQSSHMPLSNPKNKQTRKSYQKVTHNNKTSIKPASPPVPQIINTDTDTDTYNNIEHNSTLNNSTTPQITTPQIMIPPLSKSSSIASQEEPVYGCLKNGNKPTYSQYKKTLKNRSKIHSTLNNSGQRPKHKSNIPTISFDHKFKLPKHAQNRRNKLKNLQNKMATSTSKKPINKLVPVKKTIKIFKLGKNKKKRNVGVLVKSSKTRKKIKKEQAILRRTSLSDIKLYLRKHNLIKSGSCAPEDVMRRLYEDSFLAGSVYNKNPDNLLHNFLNDVDNGNDNGNNNDNDNDNDKNKRKGIYISDLG